MNKSLLFLILSFIMGGFSIFGGTILNNLYVGANIKFYYYSNNANYSFPKNIPVEHLTFLNIFFAVLFALLGVISIFVSIKKEKKQQACRVQ